MRITLVGAGYVGLVTGTCLADSGNEVTFVDSSPERLAELEAGRCPIYEPGLDHLLARNVEKGRIAFTADLAPAVAGRRIVFVCVSTNPADDGRADLSQVMAVARDLGPALSAGTIVVIKSTVPVGTWKKVRQEIARGASVPFALASNPEFLREGTAVNDFLRPDRVVLGTEDEEALDVLENLYAPFARTGKPILRMDMASAELTKYAANAYLAMRISFINELALLSEKVGVDMGAVRRGIGTDPRIGMDFLFPGPGYGGSCFPKDVQAYIEFGRDAGLTLELAEATHRVNERQKEHVARRVIEALGGEPKGKTLALWGLAFKAKTGDCRASPALFVAKRLADEGARIVAYDPEATERGLGELAGRVRLVGRPFDALAGAHALAVMTEWPEFRAPDFEQIKALLAEPVVIDARNLYKASHMRALGFRHIPIGGVVERS